MGATTAAWGCSCRTRPVGTLRLRCALVLQVTNGFSTVDIPHWMVWIFYSNPVAYAIRALGGWRALRQ